MKKVLSSLGGLVSFALCVALFAIELSFVVLVCSKEIFKESIINKIIDEIDAKEVINSFNENDMSSLYEITNVYGITKEDTNKILESEALKEFVSKYITSNIRSIVENNNEKSLSTTDLSNLIDDIIKETGLVISQENIIELKTLLNENSSKVESVLSLNSNINSEEYENIRTSIGFLFSDYVVIAYIFFFVLLFLLIMLLRWSFYRALIWYGITTIVSGTIALSLGFGLKSSLKFIDQEMYASYYNILSSIVGVIQKNLFLYSAIIVVSGIVMVIGYILIKNHKNEIVIKDLKIVDKN